MEKTIDVIFKEPGKEAVEMTIKDDLKKYQELVEGIIDITYLSYYNQKFRDYTAKTNRDIIAIVNDNGIFEGKEPNIALDPNCQSILFGNIVFVAGELDSSDWSPLNKQEKDMLKDFCFKFAVQYQDHTKQKEFERL